VSRRRREVLTEVEVDAEIVWVVEDEPTVAVEEELAEAPEDEEACLREF
jgi:hypothetical protein